MNKHKNLKALLRLAVFSAVFAALFLILELKFRDESAMHPTWAYIQSDAAEPIDILFMGNSHTYCTIDEEVLSLATGLNIRGLTCSSINGTHVAADMEALLHYQVPKVVVLEMSPFFTDNHDTMRTEKLGIVVEHFDSIRDPLLRLQAITQVVKFEDVPMGTFQLLRSNGMWNRWKGHGQPRGDYNEYGVMKMSGAVVNDGFDSTALAVRAAEYTGTAFMPEENVKALEQIIGLAEKYGFQIWFINAPVVNFSSTIADALLVVREMAEDHPQLTHIDDLMLSLQDMGIQKTDFYDSGHLNTNGQMKATLWYLQRIAERMNVSADLSGIKRFKSETCSINEDGTFTLTVNTFDRAQYRFRYKDARGKNVYTELGEENSFTGITNTSLKDYTCYVTDGDREIAYTMNPYTLMGFHVRIEGDTVTVTNDANFSAELRYAWRVVVDEEHVAVQTGFEPERTLTYTPDEEGTYTLIAEYRVGNGGPVKELPAAGIRRDASGTLTIINLPDYTLEQ